MGQSDTMAELFIGAGLLWQAESRSPPLPTPQQSRAVVYKKKNIGREGKFFEVGAARDRPSAEMIASRWAECLYRHFPAASSYYRSTINLFPAVIVLTWSPASTNSHGHSTPAALANQCQHDSSLIPCVGNVNRDWHFFPVRRQTLILCCCIL